MFYYLNGKLQMPEYCVAVIDCGGVGYKLTVSEQTAARLTGKTEALLYTYLAVREDAFELYGFISLEELAAFKMLISVSGVGAKVGMSVLSHMTPEKFALAVSTENVKALSEANGVGKKTAARIILELKDKISGSAAGAAEGYSAAASAASAASVGNGKLAEAQNALMVLGYTKAEANELLRGIDVVRLSLEDTVTAALRKISR